MLWLSGIPGSGLGPLKAIRDGIHGKEAIMNKYELAVLLHPDLEIDLEAPLKRLDEALSSVDAKVGKRDNWGKRKLAYTIDGQDFAVYLFYVVEVDPSKISELETALRLNDEVLRYLVMSYDQAADEASKDEDDTADSEPQSSDSSDSSDSKKTAGETKEE